MHATEVDDAQRAELAERIGAAHEARHRSSNRGALEARKMPTLPPLDDAPEQVDPATLRQAMKQVIPMIARCYEDAMPIVGSDPLRVSAEMTLTGDPDVGTIIDAHRLYDGNGVPLPATFDDCMRDQLQHIALPPLGDGEELAVTYPFVFTPR